MRKDLIYLHDRMVSKTRSVVTHGRHYRPAIRSCIIALNRRRLLPHIIVTPGPGNVHAPIQQKGGTGHICVRLT
jgi:hypothetical protein